MPEEWRQRAEALFFSEKKSIKEISDSIGVSVRSISKHLNTLPQYETEIERRKAENKNRTEYYRNWKRNNRTGNYHTVSSGSLKLEHIIAVKILSRERYFK